MAENPVIKVQIGGDTLRGTSDVCMSVGKESGKCRTCSILLPTPLSEQF
jgi:hypothetical protein